MASLIGRIKGFVQNDLVRAIGLLVSGTAIAQIIFAVSMPVATRLYSPGDFSLLAFFTSIVAIVSVAACLRFDIAVPIVRSDEEAANVLALALGFATLVGGAALALVLLVPKATADFLNHQTFEPYLWLLPLGIVAASYYSALQNWLVRRRAYHGIATNRVIQAVAAAAIMIGFGYFNPTPTGLLLGFAVNSGAGFLGLGYRFLRADGHLLRSVSWTTMKTAFSGNMRFPKYSTLEALFNNASIYIPIILIGSFSPRAEAGYIILAMQVMQAPIGLIGSSVAQVYLSRSPEEYYAGRLDVFTAKMLAGLLRFGVGPLMFAGIVAPDVFAIIFGDQWRPAGELVRWMTPWFIAQFLASPISMALHVTGNQRGALLLQAGGLVLRAGGVLLAFAFFANLLSETYAITGFVFYLVYLHLVLKVTGCTLAAIWRQSTHVLPILGFWIVAGFMCMAVVSAAIGLS